ncbi:MAG: relaxase/mobilization nuclease domain-containing protein [Bacteroidetes bacterium]|nr:relaxase/mobilization nuclease domain-containing protein [Bacteroidota bacterium]
MIIKIKSHKTKNSFQKLLNYMLYDKDRLFDEKGYSFIVSHNLKGNDINEWIKQYQDNEQYRRLKRVNSVLLTHEIISFHKDDATNISLEKLEDIARQYIRQRNINGMYVAVPHFDKEHYHIHICASGIEYRTGKAMRLSKTELLSVKKEIQNYQIEKYPELSKSLVNHGNEKKEYALSDKEYKYKERTGRASDKEQLIGMMKTCYKKADSKDDFYENLKACGLTTYIRGGKISGIVFNDKKFRINRLGFTDERLEELNKSINRGKEIGELREKSNEKIINRNR